MRHGAPMRPQACLSGRNAVGRAGPGGGGRVFAGHGAAPARLPWRCPGHRGRRVRPPPRPGVRLNEQKILGNRHACVNKAARRPNKSAHIPAQPVVAVCRNFEKSKFQSGFVVSGSSGFAKKKERHLERGIPGGSAFEQRMSLSRGLARGQGMAGRLGGGYSRARQAGRPGRSNAKAAGGMEGVFQEIDRLVISRPAATPGGPGRFSVSRCGRRGPRTAASPWARWPPGRRCGWRCWGGC